LDNDHADVQDLGDGETLTDSFTVYTEDGTAQQIDITIHGANHTFDTAITYDIGASAGNSLGSAYDLTDLDYRKSNDPDIDFASTKPSVTISARTTDNEHDYFKLVVAQNGTEVSFDIDYAYPDFDPYIELLNSGGGLIVYNDDRGNIDNGS